MGRIGLLRGFVNMSDNNAAMQRIYFLLNTLQPERPTRVVDIGARMFGNAVYGNLMQAGYCELWGFEPEPEAYGQLCANAGPTEHYLPYAVGDGTPGELKICEGGHLSSLFEPNMKTIALIGQDMEPAWSVRQRVPVDTVRLDDVDEIPEFDLLKIDIQGGELAVFENGRDKLTNALAVISECAVLPIYQEQPLLDDQMRALRSMGYHLHKFQSLLQWKCRRPANAMRMQPSFRSQHWDGDVIFVRGLLDLQSLPVERVKHLALLADAVFESHDLAVVMLDELAQRGVIQPGASQHYVSMVPINWSGRQDLTQGGLWNH